MRKTNKITLLTLFLSVITSAIATNTHTDAQRIENLYILYNQTQKITSDNPSYDIELIKEATEELELQKKFLENSKLKTIYRTSGIIAGIISALSASVPLIVIPFAAYITSKQNNRITWQAMWQEYCNIWNTELRRAEIGNKMDAKFTVCTPIIAILAGAGSWYLLKKAAQKNNALQKIKDQIAQNDVIIAQIQDLL